MQQGFARELSTGQSAPGARPAASVTSQSAVVSAPWQTAPKEQRTGRPHEAVAVPYPRHQAARRCLPSMTSPHAAHFTGAAAA